MKYMLLMNYGGADCAPMTEWAPEEVKNHIAFQRQLGKELTDSDGRGDRLAGHHRLHATRARLLELAGDLAGAAEQYRVAASRTASVRERHYLTTRAARLKIRARDSRRITR
jgi:hypothetical protein